MSEPSASIPSRILLTGGAGFIGSHLAEALLGRGCRLLILDDLNPYYDPALKRANLEQVRRAGSFEFVCGDICDAPLVDGLFSRFRPEAVIHLAARAGVRPSLEQPALYQRVNVEGTAVLLEAARRCGVPLFLFASSSSVYGAASRVPFSEEDPVRAPTSPYAASKIAGEALCHVYS
ncbi:GDP-mannose 4,6-dehydratase, partial [Tepidiforma sp.]|uniref:GDP-mannose 4,6-dehydratase n=1 Tax=Tepidiforma sp. TaxID=2682230 RepID=UPI002635A2D5